MGWFISKLIFSAIFMAFGVAVGLNYLNGLANEKILRLCRKGAFVIAFVLFLWAIIGTSCYWVPSSNFATLRRIYFGTPLPPGTIVARKGQLGPQAEILTTGFHLKPMLTILNEIKLEPVFTVPEGMTATLSAKDGMSLNGEAFAAPWDNAVRDKMANDAEFFLASGGQRGPQVTTLFPAQYTLNPFVWEKPELVPATRVEQGTLGVVKSSKHAAVDFGPFKYPMPESNKLQVLTNQLPSGSGVAQLCPVGAVGLWEVGLSPGLYYLHPKAYRVTSVPTIALVFEYKGGYTKRTVHVELDKEGQILTTYQSTDVPVPPGAADSAVYTKPEGWDVPQELRVLVQITPELAPYVVGVLGLDGTNTAQVIEDRVVTPVVRSVVRDVIGGTPVFIKTPKALVDNEGIIQYDDNSQPKITMTSEFRPAKVLDLLDNRSSLEEAMELRAKPEGEKEGIKFLEVRLGESSIPPELLVARLREQLAQQLQRALVEEEKAQVQRQKTENARAMASKQEILVEAKIAQEAATARAEARKTEGEGEKNYLIASAEGQEAQKKAIGEQATVQLMVIDRLLKSFQEIAKENPEILTSALSSPQKFVPHVMVSGGGNLEGASAIFGSLLKGIPDSPKAEITEVKK